MDTDTRLDWWRTARFGMFIHWGLYSIPAGSWKGIKVHGIAEWIMKRARIPRSEYEQLASQFNPVNFSADAIADLAVDAGMRYIAFTAKHHDGFALFKSGVSDYNVVDATPFGRDIVAELAEACRKRELPFCLYYSHAQDWHHPDAIGNDWDFSDESAKSFDQYMEEKALPQVRELLSNYGPVGLIWFDTPQTITAEQSRRFTELVRAIQPDCLVSGRVGHGFGDYYEMGDNQYPAYPLDVDWETPATLNDTWGFDTDDHNWKSAEELVSILVETNGKGGNYLLNIGPTGSGTVPEESESILRDVGNWVRTNGESIYGSGAAPLYPFKTEWGAMTAKGSSLYAHVFRWPRATSHAFQGRYGIMIRNLVQRVKSASVLDTGESLDFAQTSAESLDRIVLNVALPERPSNDIATVIRLELDAPPEFTQFARTM